jgi:hypothetical protein
MLLERLIGNDISGNKDAAGNAVDDIGSIRTGPPPTQKGLAAVPQDDQVNVPGASPADDELRWVTAEQLSGRADPKLPKATQTQIEEILSLSGYALSAQAFGNPHARRLVMHDQEMRLGSESLGDQSTFSQRHKGFPSSITRQKEVLVQG